MVSGYLHRRPLYLPPGWDRGEKRCSACKKEDVRRSGNLSVGTGCSLSADVAPARLPTRPPLLLAPTRGHAHSRRHRPPWPPLALHAVPPPPATLRMSQDLKPHLLGSLVLTGPIAAAQLAGTLPDLGSSRAELSSFVDPGLLGLPSLDSSRKKLRRPLLHLRRRSPSDSGRFPAEIGSSTAALAQCAVEGRPCAAQRCPAGAPPCPAAGRPYRRRERRAAACHVAGRPARALDPAALLGSSARLAVRVRVPRRPRLRASRSAFASARHLLPPCPAALAAEGSTAGEGRPRASTSSRPWTRRLERGNAAPGRGGSTAGEGRPRASTSSRPWTRRLEGGNAAAAASLAAEARSVGGELGRREGPAQGEGDRAARRRRSMERGGHGGWGGSH
ncbi:hypothetical protein PVAP13_4NG207733 [Panicum virgatum]|uniref:Uncharacterized protein n=1 Tax=Panicum virgatum TaxID=38727 RepID=A0A8T0TB00_PANVG|nr:hypothetical protein PVAP13_4NG207733 [Panicum virgatum]